MGSRDGPSLDRVYIRRDTGATFRQFCHVMTPLTCLEMYAALLNCDNTTELTQPRTLLFAYDQSDMAAYKRGGFNIIDRGLIDLPPSENDPFIQQVKGIMTLNQVRAAQLDSVGATMASPDVNVE